MVGVGRDLWGSSSPNLLLKQGHLQHAAQDLVQAGLEYVQGRRLHTPSGQPVQCSVTLKVKKFFLITLDNIFLNVFLFPTQLGTRKHRYK